MDYSIVGGYPITRSLKVLKSIDLPGRLEAYVVRSEGVDYTVSGCWGAIGVYKEGCSGGPP